VAAALVVGCSDRSNLIPPQSASSLKDSLAQVRAAADAGDCTRAQTALDQTIAQAGRLPSTVDRRLRQRINEGLRTLRDTVPRDCAANRTQPATTDTTPTTTETTPTDTTPTDTTPTTPTDTTPTTPTDTTPSTTEPAPPTTDTTPADTTANGGTPGVSQP
jgi:hypothetical protein